MEEMQVVMNWPDSEYVLSRCNLWDGEKQNVKENKIFGLSKQKLGISVAETEMTVERKK